MMINQQYEFLRKCSIRIICLISILGITTIAFAEYETQDTTAQSDTLKRKANLTRIMNVLPDDRVVNGRVSFLDKTF